MSGGTGTGYRVETAAERRLRAQRAALADFAAASTELATLRAEAAGYRSVYGRMVAKVPAAPRLRTDPDPETVAAATATVAEQVREHRERLRAAVLTASREAVSELIAVPAPESPAANGAPPARTSEAHRSWDWAPVPAPAAPQPWRAALAERAAELLSRLPGEADTRVRQRCHLAAGELATASQSRARLLLTDLAERVRSEARRVAAVQQTRAELARLDTSLAAAGLPAARLRQRIAVLLADDTEKVPADLAADVTELLARADRQRQQVMVAAALRESLDALGYDLAEDFETALAGGEAVTALPGAAGYGLRVLLDQDRAVLRTQVVRAAGVDSDPERDQAAEQSFCDGFPALLDRLAHRGVRTDPLGRYPPGTVPVPAVADALLPLPAPAARRQEHTREREL